VQLAVDQAPALRHIHTLFNFGVAQFLCVHVRAAPVGKSP
jgi:hypothetical protein